MNISKDQLRTVLAHLEKSNNAERTRIARVLHDDLSQKLTALLMELSFLQGDFPADSKHAQKIEEISAIVSSVGESVRSLTNSLRSKILEEFGFIAALKQETSRLAKEGVLVKLLTRPAEVTLPREVSEALFNIFQTVVGAAVARDQVKEIQVTTRTSRDCFILQISAPSLSDRLFEEASVESLSLHERAGRAGIKIKMSNTTDSGSVITARVRLARPLASQESAD